MRTGFDTVSCVVRFVAGFVCRAVGLAINTLVGAVLYEVLLISGHGDKRELNGRPLLGVSRCELALSHRSILLPHLEHYLF